MTPSRWVCRRGSCAGEKWEVNFDLRQIIGSRQVCNGRYNSNSPQTNIGSRWAIVYWKVKWEGVNWKVNIELFYLIGQVCNERSCLTSDELVDTGGQSTGLTKKFFLIVK